jgi:uncharacterized protein YcaQ
MPARPRKPVTIAKSDARRLWLEAQRLTVAEPFGKGPEATRLAVEHLGYVQIDTIHVIERSHHHILFTRIPSYRRADLHRAQDVDKTVFEYWTHALAYVPTPDFRFFMGQMKHYQRQPMSWFGSVTKADLRKVLTLIRKGGPLTIRDIDDDVLVEKTHPWASRKPSKRALQAAFFSGALTVSNRAGMLKTYDLTDRHFGWNKRPKPATERQYLDYLIERGLRSQGIVSLDSICFMDAKRKPGVRKLIEGRVRRKELVPVTFEGVGKQDLWASPSRLDGGGEPIDPGLVHILSPFDPLIIQRKRLKLFFDYDHIFEAYVPKEKRKLGYFALPVLVGDEIVAAIDLKADRAEGKLLVQKWTWIGKDAAKLHKKPIEEALHRFERFQLAK